MENGFDKPMRRTCAEISFALTPPEIKQRAVLSYPAENEFSRGSQVIDEIENLSAKIATFEPNYWKLDGTFALPKDKNKSKMEVGWWSEKLSDSEGNIPNGTVFRVEFDVIYNIPLIAVAFDEKSGEVVSDFKITAFNSSNVKVLEESFFDNKEFYVRTKNDAVAVKRVEIEIYKTANPYRYARISEIDFGVKIKFTDDDILGLTLTNEGDVGGTRFPYSEFRFSTTNKGMFSFLDKDSLAKHVMKRQAVEYRHGVYENELLDGQIQWVDCGTYYVSDWAIENKKVTFTAMGKSVALDNIIYTKSNNLLISLRNLIDDVKNTTGFMVYVPEFFRDNIYLVNSFGEISYRELVTVLAEATCTMIYENRENHIVFADVLDENNFETTEMLDFSKMLSYPKNKLDKYYNAIMIREKTLTNGSISKGGDLLIKADWHDINEPTFFCNVDLPCFVKNVNTVEYQKYLNWFAERKFKVLQKRMMTEVFWRQNPAYGLVLGRQLDIECEKGKDMQSMTVFSQTIEYEGGILKGTCKAIGKAVL